MRLQGSRSSRQARPPHPARGALAAALAEVGPGVARASSPALQAPSALRLPRAETAGAPPTAEAAPGPPSPALGRDPGALPQLRSAPATLLPAASALRLEEEARHRADGTTAGEAQPRHRDLLPRRSPVCLLPTSARRKTAAVAKWRQRAGWRSDGGGAGGGGLVGGGAGESRGSVTVSVASALWRGFVRTGRRLPRPPPRRAPAPRRAVVPAPTGRGQVDPRAGRGRAAGGSGGRPREAAGGVRRWRGPTWNDFLRRRRRGTGGGCLRGDARLGRRLLGRRRPRFPGRDLGRIAGARPPSVPWVDGPVSSARPSACPCALQDPVVALFVYLFEY